jgi:hypothetical protein
MLKKTKNLVNKRNARKFKFLIKPSLFILFSVIFVRILGLTTFPDKVFPAINQFFSRILFGISSHFSTSLGDIFYVILILFTLFILGLIGRNIWKRKYQMAKYVLSFFLYFLAGFYLFFHIIWGFNYYKTPIKEIYNVELNDNSLDELKRIAHHYFIKSVYYRNLVEEDSNGVFKMSMTHEELKSELNNSAKEIGIKYPELRLTPSSPPNMKASLFSEAFSYMGVLGYYIPFTTEAQYNEKMPDSKMVFTKCHETAHQWGYASESEANFIGFVLGIESEHPDLLYASNFKAMRSVLNRILWVDPLYVKYYVEVLYSDGMKRDRQYELDVNVQYGGSAEDAFSLMNEAFLRLNNQEGLESYGRFVELLVGFNRKYGSTN